MKPDDQKRAGDPPATEMPTEDFGPTEQNADDETHLTKRAGESDVTADVTVPTPKPATKRMLSEGDNTELPTDLFVSAYAESKVPTQRLDGGVAPEKLAGQIAHFKVIEKLGSGGFGTVLRAYDTQLDREVAVKIIKHDVLDSKRLVKQFEAEARAAAQLRHPNIVSVHQSGEYGTDQTFIVFDFIRGTTLRSLLKVRDQFSVQDRIRTLAKVADALGYAHSKRIVHRDIKPENILIELEEDQLESEPALGTPHVADFGCARRQQWDTISESTQTKRPKQYTGTPPYFSPEQASGRSADADARSDVWALGVLMDELITGDRPFRDFEVSRNALFDAICNIDPPPINERAGVDRDLAAIWQTCLAKDPNQRYRSATELNEDLEAWLRGQPVSVRPISTAERFYRWGKKNPLMAALILAVFVTTALGFLISSLFYGRELIAKRELVQNQVAKLLDADQPIEGVGNVLSALQQAHLSEVSRAELTKGWNDAAPDSLQRTRAAIALSRFPEVTETNLGAEIREHLDNELLQAPASELALIYPSVSEVDPQLYQRYIGIADSGKESPSRRLRAITAVCNFFPDRLVQEKKVELAENVVRFLQSESLGISELSAWVPLLGAIREQLDAPLNAALDSPQPRIQRVGTLLFELYADDPDYLLQECLSVRENDDQVLAILFPAIRSALLASDLSTTDFIQRIRGISAEMHAHAPTTENRKALANLWMAALFVTDGERIGDIPPLNDERDPTVGSHFVQRAAANGVPIRHLMSAVRQALNDDRTTALQHFLNAMATNSIEAPSDVISECENVMQQLWEHPDSGVHAAWEMLTSAWNIAPPDEAPSPNFTSNRHWRTSVAGHRMIRIQPTVAFPMGSTDAEREQFGVTNLDSGDDGEIRHLRAIDWSYEISAHEVTVAQFMTFLESLQQEVDDMLEDAEKAESKDEDRIGQLEALWSHLRGQLDKLNDEPVNNIDQPYAAANWYDATAYCVWLSRQAGLPSCYGDIVDIYEAFQRMKPAAVDRSVPGYRLPSEAEWEFACRAGSETPWHFGRDAALIDNYAVSATNSGDRLQPVGILKPNRWGIFDMLGNVQEWTDSPVQAYPRQSEPFSNPMLVDTKIQNVITRGGDYTQNEISVRSAWRGTYQRIAGSSQLGFRVVRTLTDSPAGDASDRP